jgi:hypothetical protein
MADPVTETTTHETSSRTGRAIGGVAVVVAVGALVRLLDQGVPAWTEGTGFGGIAAVIEYPV